MGSNAQVAQYVTIDNANQSNSNQKTTDLVFIKITFSIPSSNTASKVISSSASSSSPSSSANIKANPTSDKSSSLFTFNSSKTITSSNKSKRKILNNISGYVKSGQLLAILGPSGSGKTTLLNILSGRVKPDDGCVWINGEPLNKQIQRKICYVLQHDIFFPDLTLRQTLIYTALLRLPEWLTYEQKIHHVENIINLLDLRQCQNTIIGNVLKRGLSGGEKKRANIACELLSNPTIMLLDEPTSGLDSTTAFNIIKTLKDYAIREKKMIITTIHQPSSQIYHLFDKLMFISKGSLAYFGDLQDFVPFLTRLDFNIDPHFSPADFMMDKLKNSEEDELKIVNAAKELIKLHKINQTSINLQSNEDDEDIDLKTNDRDLQENNPLWSNDDNHNHHHQQQHHHHYHHHHHHLHHHHNPHSNHSHYNHNHNDELNTNDIKTYELRVMIDPCSKNNTATKVYNKLVNNDYDSGHSSFIETDRSSTSTFSSSSFASTEEMYFNCQSSNYASSYRVNHNHNEKESKWPTSFWTQFNILVQRNFFEAKGRLLFKLNWIQTIGLGLISGLMWFQVSRTEKSIDNIRGWMFFATSYWMLFSLFDALVSLPLERDVINKERSSGIYRLSSYYLAKLVGELPLTITLPTVFFFISYPLFSLHSIQVLFIQWAFLILNTIVAQTIGFVIAITSSDIEMSVTVAAIYSTATNLFAGFYSNTIPWWLSFLKYTSIVYYAFQNMQAIEFTYGPPITCSHNDSRFKYCLNSIANGTSSDNLIIPYTEIIKEMNKEDGQNYFPIWMNTSILLAFFTFFQIIGYLVLRFVKKPK